MGKKESYAVASLILGIVSIPTITAAFTIFGAIVPVITSMLAIIFGVISLKSAKRKMALAGICTGIVTIALLIIGTILLVTIFSNLAKSSETGMMRIAEYKYEQSEYERVKIDANKDWVYETDYSKGNIKLPFININSDDAKKVNKEIEELYTNENLGDEIYNKENNRNVEYNGSIFGKNLTVFVITTEGKDGDTTIKNKTYSFDLKTLKLITIE